MPFEPATFDAAYMMHVGMNIPDKDTLFAEIRRVLKPGGMFAVFDVMLTGRGELRFPLPCATTPDLAFFATAAEYRRAIEAAGFAVVCERDRREQACSFFRSPAGAGPVPASPLGVHLLLRDDPHEVFRNVVAMFEGAALAPTEMICRAT
jgi:SAM-dependent methyltransferase